MNEGCYAETLVKRKMTAGAILGMIGMSLLVTAGLVLTFMNRFGVFALVAAVLVIFIFYRFLRVEYEYIFVTGELQVDRIYSGSVRKAGPRIDITNVERVERIADEALKELKSRPKGEVLDYTSHIGDPEIYVVRYHDNMGSKFLLFEPDEKLLKTMWRSAPSKVKIPKE
jgi:hypothetical protein